MNNAMLLSTQAFWILSCVGVLLVLAVVSAGRIVADEVRRCRFAKTMLFVTLSVFVAYWGGGKGSGDRGAGRVQSHGAESEGVRGTSQFGVPNLRDVSVEVQTPYACDVGGGEGFGEMPVATNLMLTAIARGETSTAVVVSWPLANRPAADLVGIYAGTNIIPLMKLFQVDVTGCLSNALVVVADADLSGTNACPAAFISAGDSTDTDGDGLPDPDERFVYRTDPYVADSDGDQLSDGEEVAMGSSPLSTDTDDDGLGDGEETGWIRQAECFEWYDSTGWVTEYGCDPWGMGGGGLHPPDYPMLYGSLTPPVPFYDTSLDTLVAYHCGYVSYFTVNSYVLYFEPLFPSPLSGTAGNCGTLLVVPYWMYAEMPVGDTNSFMRVGYVASNGVHVVEYRNLKKYGTNQGVTMQVIVPTGTNRTVRISYLNADFWMDGSDAVVGVQNQGISTTDGYYNLTFNFSKFGPILPQTTWEYHLGYATDTKLADTDGDGLSDSFEIGVFHSDPLCPDCDGDGLTDVQEYALGTNPRSDDSDGDLLPDGWEVANNLNPLSAEGNDGRLADIDNDGLTNLQEYQNGTNPTLCDTDNDGLSDGVELFAGTDPVNPDTDNDGLSDGVELGHSGVTGLGTDPLLADTDGDFLPDGWEHLNGLNPLSDAGDNGGAGDPDDDGLSNFYEFVVGATPLNSHTFSFVVDDSAYVRYGMCAFPPLNGVEVSVSVGDSSGSHSERWMMVLEEEGGFGRKYQVVCDSYGLVSARTIILEPGRHYIGRIEHLATEAYSVTDYDWMAQIDGLPATSVMSSQRERWICIADKLVMIDNESGLLGVCDESFGLENFAAGRHFDVYTVSVRPTNVKFNWDTASSSSDAINLRENYGTPYDVSGGEYTLSQNIPVCYVTNVVPVVKAKFSVVPESVSSLELDAVLEGTLLSDLGASTVNFSSGESGFAAFDMSGGVAAFAGMSATNSFAWRVRAINGIALSSPRTVAFTGPHKTYVIFAEPVEPWSNVPNSQNNAWSTALDLVCGWNDGCNTWQSAATGITRSIFESGKFSYDTRDGDSWYTSRQGWIFFDEIVYLGAVIDRFGGGPGRGTLVNCSDCASMVCSFANLMGCELYESRMGAYGSIDSWFATNPYCAIGRADWTPPSWGWSFSFHEVAWSGSCGNTDIVFDACLSVDGDSAPGVSPYLKVLPAALVFCDGNPGAPIVYKEMLTPSSSDGYYKCAPRQSEKTRRLLR